MTASSTTLRIDQTRDCEVWQYTRRIKEHEYGRLVFFDRSQLSDLCLCKLLLVLKTHHRVNVETMHFRKQRLTSKAIATLLDFPFLSRLIVNCRLSERELVSLTQYMTKNRLSMLAIDGKDSQVMFRYVDDLLKAMGGVSKLEEVQLARLHIQENRGGGLEFFLAHSRARIIQLTDVLVDDVAASFATISSQHKVEMLALAVSPKYDSKLRSILPFYCALFENLTMLNRLQSVYFARLAFDCVATARRQATIIQGMRSAFKMVRFHSCLFSLDCYNLLIGALCNSFRCEELILDFNVIDVRAIQSPRYYSFAESSTLKTLGLRLNGSHDYAKSYLRSFCSDLNVNESVEKVAIHLTGFLRSPRALPFLSMNRTIRRLSLEGQWPANIQVFGDDEVNSTLKYIECIDVNPHCAFSLQRFTSLEHLVLRRCDVRTLAPCPWLKRLDLVLTSYIDRHLDAILSNFTSLEHLYLSIKNAPTLHQLEILRVILLKNTQLQQIICREGYLNIDHVIKREEEK